MDAKHHAGLHYDIHGLYGVYAAKATNEALKALFPGKRPYVLSGNSFPGASKYSVKWLGENKSTFKSMRHSVTGTIKAGLFG